MKSRKLSVKKPSNQTYRQTPDRPTELDQTSRIQTETAVKARIRKNVDEVSPDVVVQKVREILERSSEADKIAIQGDLRRKELAVELYNEMVDNRLEVRFDANTYSEEIVAKLVRHKDGNVVWQFPPEHSLEMKKLLQEMPGIAVDKLA